MNAELILSLVKARQGISSTVRDTYLTAIINGVFTELEEEKGLLLDENNANHIIFVVDLVTWRYQNPGGPGTMPRDLQYRLNNMYFHARRTIDDI